MPCVTLLETDTSQLSNLKSRSRGEASKWINLEFLNMSPESGRGGRAYWIHKAQVSFVIHGSDDTRWTAYAFVDTESKSLCGKRIEEQEMGDTDTDDGQEADDDDDDGVNEDPIAHDRSSSDVVDADKPTWDPRMYFIMVFDHRSNRMAQEWKKIVKALDRAIKRRDAPKDPQKAHEYMVELLDIVEKLYDWSTETVGTWKRFSRKDGDINFFRDITDERARGRLDRIRDSFVTIEKCGLDLKRIRKNCGRVEDNVCTYVSIWINTC